jgi:hypothetical protein
MAAKLPVIWVVVHYFAPEHKATADKLGGIVGANQVNYDESKKSQPFIGHLMIHASSVVNGIRVTVDRAVLLADLESCANWLSYGEALRKLICAGLADPVIANWQRQLAARMAN